jgi:hypothetical protein
LTLIPISYPQLSLSGSGHTELKNDPDWSIHKLLDPYPMWCSHARPIWVNTIYFALFCLKICLFWLFFLLFVRKSGEGIKELIYAYLNSFGKSNRLRYGNNSYSWFTLSESIDGNDGICPWPTILECYYWKEIQAYKTYKRTRILGLCLYKIWDFLIEL